MKLSVVALVVIFTTVAYAADESDLDAWNAAVQRLRALKERRGWWSGGNKKVRCDTGTDKALTKSYNALCKSKFSTYTEGIKTASALLQKYCSKLNDECCTSEEGCKDTEISECCPK